MTKQRGQPNAGAASNIAHGRVDTVLCDDVARDRENMVVIFPSVGSHISP
jgi:hypothetical protein